MSDMIMINRQDAIDALIKMLSDCFYADEEVLDAVKTTLNELPPAQPEPQERKGEWIQFPSHNAYKCSECGRVIVTTDGKNNVCKHYPYCHCGAKMEVDNGSN